MFKVNKAQATLLKIVDNPSNVKKKRFLQINPKNIKSLIQEFVQGAKLFFFRGKGSALVGGLKPSENHRFY